MRVRSTAGVVSLAAASLLLLLGFAPGAQADPKGAFVIGTAGVTGTTGGLFNNPLDVAVSKDGSGDLYVADAGNHRVQRFDAAGDFELAFGWNVVAEGGAGDTPGDGFEICTVAADCQAGEPGATGEGGRLQSPTGLAIDPNDDSLYVFSRGKNRVEKFDPDGNWLLAFGDGVEGAADVCTVAASCTVGTTGAGAGQFAAPFQLVEGVAVHPVTGDVFVADTRNQRVAHYLANGSFLRAWGWGVVPGGGDGFEICTVATTCQKGTEISTPDGSEGFQGNTPRTIAVGPNGIVYAGPSRGKLYRFDSAQSDPASMLLDPLVLGVLTSATFAEVDGEDNHPFVFAANVFLEFDPATLQELSRHLDGKLNLDPTGYGRNDASGDQYLSFNSSAVLALNEAGAPLASAPTAPTAENVAAHSADLEVTVDPNSDGGIRATGRFQVRKPGGGWLSIGTPVDLGTTTSPVLVEQSVTGLEANTAYELRFLVTKPYGNPDVVSPVGSLSTPVVPPDVSTGSPVQVSTKTALVAGRVNPNNLPTTYHVQYGATPAYELGKAPIPDADADGAGLQKAVAVLLAGLAPGTTYHYRFVAANSEGTAFGEDEEFTTRSGVDAIFEQRGLEMVTPPDKSARRVLAVDGATELANTGMPSPDGESMLFSVPLGILNSESGVGAAHFDDWSVLRRTPAGWVTSAVNNVDSPGTGIGSLSSVVATSADFGVQAWQHKSYLFESKSGLGTRLLDDSGGPRGKGWYDWLADNPALVDLTKNTAADEGLVDDAGARMLRWSGPYGYKGLLGPEDPSNALIAEGEPGSLEQGDAIYLQEPPATGPLELVNECSGAVAALETQTITMGASGGTFTLGFEGATTTSIPFGAPASTVRSRLQDLATIGTDNATVSKSGSVWTVTFTGALAGADVPQLTANGAALTGGGASVATLSDGDPGDATLVPARASVGTPANLSDDTIGAWPCAEGAVTNLRGAVVGGGGILSPGGGTTRTAMSGDGARVFLTSPDPEMPTGQGACTNATGAKTACPPQLFVRQRDSEGNATVRWISKPEIAGQQVGLLGPTGFEGASDDGQVVYFKTKSPLTEDDPNGGAQVPGGIKAGTASDASWDLYRYELPGDRDADPAGGTLTRVSGGPAGSADPNVLDTGAPGAAALRFLSEDGSKAYFVTRGIIGAPGDAWNQAPKGGTTTPAGTTSASSTRNLYLFDAEKQGDARWRLIAVLPTTGHAANRCASLNARSGMPQEVSSGAFARSPIASCLHGLADGRAIAFETAAQLTPDDSDTASDVYLYDAALEELVRVSAPADEGASAYLCDDSGARCNADLGAQPRALSNADRIGLNGAQRLNLATSPSGAVSVFFETRVALLPADANGAHMDVYEWQAGELHLISPGDTADDSYFSGNSEDGEDVFFLTQRRIDPREIDEDWDLYDARVGGGFPYTQPRNPCDVLGEGCHAAPGTPPAAPGAASANLRGEGNVVEKPKKRCTKPRKARKGAKQRCPKQKKANKSRNGGRR